MSAPDPQFLRVAIEVLDRLRLESLQRQHPLLAHMIELAKGEAEDELRTEAIEFQRRSEFKDRAITTKIEAELKKEVFSLRQPPDLTRSAGSPTLEKQDDFQSGPRSTHWE